MEICTVRIYGYGNLHLQGSPLRGPVEGPPEWELALGTYWQDPADLKQLMASKEILISWAWNETAVALIAENHPVKMKIDTKEGASTWVCGYVKMANAPGSEQKAYDFIDAFLSDSAATYLLTEWGYGHTNENVMNRIGKENGFASLETYTKNTLMQSPLSHKIREQMIKDFEKIKAGY